MGKDTRWILLGSHRIGLGALQDPSRSQYLPRPHGLPRQGAHGQDAHYGQGDSGAPGTCGQLEQSARAFLARIRHGPAEAVFPRAVSWQAAPGLLSSGMSGSQPLQECQPRRYPDGSVSFGGHFALKAPVSMLSRTGAIDPHTAAVIHLARGWNGFVHKSAMSALDVPGAHQGTLDPEGGDVVGELEDFACRSLERHGVYPDRVFCSRPTARRLLIDTAGVGGGAIALRGKAGISVTVLPLGNNVLHMMDPLDRLLHTDGGVAMGYTPTKDGYNLEIRGRPEFATDISPAGARSAGTWEIPPSPEGGAAEPTGQDALPLRPEALRRPDRAPREGASGAVPSVASPRRRIPLLPLTCELAS